MKKFKYQIREVYNIGTTENPVLHTEFYEKIVDYTEANMEIAKAEAVGEISPPFDDGQPDPASEPTTDDILNALLGVSA